MVLRGEAYPPAASVASSAPARRPALLPPDTYGFTGRAAQLARLDEALAKTAEQPTAVPVCLVTGAPGVGKTTLAVHWAHRVRRQFPDGQLYIDLRAFGSRPAAPTPAQPRIPPPSHRRRQGGRRSCRSRADHAGGVAGYHWRWRSWPRVSCSARRSSCPRSPTSSPTRAAGWTCWRARTSPATCARCSRSRTAGSTPARRGCSAGVRCCCTGGSATTRARRTRRTASATRTSGWGGTKRRSRTTSAPSGCFERVGSRLDEAEVLDHLGDARAAAGAPDAARTAWSEALAILEPLGYAGAATVRSKLTGTAISG